MRRGHLVALFVAAALAASACGGGGDGDDDGAGGSTGDTAVGLATIHTVPQLEPLGRRLVDAYNATSDAPVQLAVGAQTQAIQAVSTGGAGILPGAWLSGVDVDSTAIGRNLAIIAVRTGNPSQVDGLDAFARDSGLDTTVCGPDSPFGNLAAAILVRAGVQVDPADVASGCEMDALGRVAGGELDAALMFRLFLALPPEIEVVDVPEEHNIVLDVRYLPASAEPSRGSFEAFLRGEAAMQVLAELGLLP